jgi:hypothetical protein
VIFSTNLMPAANAWTAVTSSRMSSAGVSEIIHLDLIPAKVRSRESNLVDANLASEGFTAAQYDPVSHHVG